uniref:nascent polypeptide-associated complex subunit alpha, muscle-specific form isoform X9 n=1 Tax=Osmia lignaria TaxID=473952 RepID=UPI0014784351|nr:nascent polypeptide-associated complex subunit alpha, muscle-specific form isoform X9 [Osmia lignaria]
MPANKGNLSTPHKEKAGNGLTTGASKKKKRCTVKHKKHCKQYLQLHSEYRSTYTWHEYTGPHQEHTVVRRAPQPPPTSTKQPSAKLQSAKSTEDENNEGPTLEPPLPRRKKCPELAYKTHEFITAADGGGVDAVDSNVVADKVREVTAQSGLPPSQLSKAISRISTEYRLQFAWPRRPQLMNGETVAPGVPAAGIPAGTTGPPRKSLSMGALKQGIAPTGPAPVHKKRPGDVDHKRDGMQASELEPLVGGTGTDTIDGAVPEGDEREEDVSSDLKITFRGKKSGRTVRISDDKVLGKQQEKPFPTSEVIELRRLADEYKHRDWGCGLAAEDEASLWKRVSSNHALNALSLARSVTKEEKEKENTRKVAPITTTMTMPPAGQPSCEQTRPIHGILQDDSKTDIERVSSLARARKDFLIRHHLDRTTGVGDGALLPSPTREKLEPVIPRRREDAKEHREEIQPKTKSSPKNSPRTGRSQSLGPTVTERRSPKRQPPRAPSVTKEAKEKEKEREPKDKEKEHREKSGEPERHPRPRVVAGVSVTGPGHVRWSIREPSAVSSTGSSSSVPPLPPPPSGPGPTPFYRRSPQVHRKLTAEPQVNGDVTGGESSVASTPPSQSQPPMSATAVSPWIDDEPVVKSPPEPTRVKSPEQMIMRSPEPVNWTVPLDTGKTFTVTQNVREEPLTRPHSEAKTWAPSSAPSAPQSAPPELAAQHKSQHSQHSGYKSPESESVSLGSFSGLNGHKDMDSERDSPLPTNVQSASTPVQAEKGVRKEMKLQEAGSVEEESKDQQRSEPSIKPVAGTNLRCLEDPGFEYDRKKDVGAQPTTTATMTTPSSSTPPQPGYRILEAESPQPAGTAGGYHVLEAPTVVPGSAQRSAASEVLEKARNRFDKFWGKGSGSEN